MWGNSFGGFGFSSRSSWRNSYSTKIGVKEEKNPGYEPKKLIMIQGENNVPLSKYKESVPDDFVGILLIKIREDHIGRSSGNAMWCRAFEYVDGEIIDRGMAIHKESDYDYTDYNYNEKVWSLIGKVVLDPEHISVPQVDLAKRVEDQSTREPDVISYSVVDQETQEMTMMKTIVFNVLERQDMDQRSDRVPLDIILKSVELQIMKKVKIDKRNLQEKIKQTIIDLELEEKLDGKNLEDEKKLLEVIKEKVEYIDENTTLEDFARSISQTVGREYSPEDLSKIEIKGMPIADMIIGIKQTTCEKKDNYSKLEEAIIQTTILDLFTNNIDRHLNNWALIRDKATDTYKLGVFDHAVSLLNMSLDTECLAQPYDYIRQYWATSSVLLDRPEDLKRFATEGKDLFAYIMENYREYTMKFLQVLHDKLPEIQKAIGYREIPMAEYDKLSDEEKKKYYAHDSDKTVNSDRIMKEFKDKFKDIEKGYGLNFEQNENANRNDD